MEDPTKPICRIENWSVVSTPIDTMQLRGEVYDHPNFQNGKLIYSSVIINVMPPNKGRLQKGDKVETRNSIYFLGVTESEASALKRHTLPLRRNSPI